MPRLLTPEEIAERYSQGYRAEPTEQAGYGSLFGATVDQVQAGLYGVGEAFGLPLGNARRENQYLGALETQRFYEDTGTPQSFREIEGVGDAARWVAALGVQSAPYMLGIAGGALAGGPAGALAVGATFGTADVLQNQREQAGYTRLDTAIPLGVAYGAVDALTGVGGTITRGIARRELERNTVRALDKLGGVRGVAARTGATFVRKGAEEAAGETFQEGMNQLGRISVDPSVGLFDQEAMDRYAESAVAGFALGGVTGAGLGGWRRSKGFQPAPIEDDTPTDLLARRQAAPVEATAQPANKSKVFSVEEELLISHGVSNISPKKVELVAEIANRGLDPDSEALEPFWTALAENKLGNARKTLASAIAEANAASSAAVPQPAAPVQPSVSLPGQPAGLPATAPAVVGVSSTQGVVSGAQAPQAQQASPQKPQAPAPAAPGTAAAGQAPVTPPVAASTPAPAPAPQPVSDTAPTNVLSLRKSKRAVDVGALPQAQAYVAPEPVEAPMQAVLPEESGDGYASDAEAWEDMRPEEGPSYDALPEAHKQAWALARKQGKASMQLADQITEDTLAQDDVAADDAMQTLVQIFGEGDAKIIYNRFVLGMTAEEAANEAGGISRSKVQKLTGGGKQGAEERAKKIKAAQKKYGWTDDYVKNLLRSYASDDVVVESSGGAIDGDLSSDDTAFGAVDMDAGGRDPSLYEAGFSTSEKLGGSVSNWKDSLGKRSARDRSPKDDARLAELNAELEVLNQNDTLDEEQQARVQEIEAEISTIEAKYVTPQELAASVTQRAFDIAQRTDELMSRIREAYDNGEKTIALSNRKVSLTESVKQVRELRRAIRAKLAEAEAVLKRAESRKAEGAEPTKAAAPAPTAKEKPAKAPATKMSPGQKLWETLVNSVPGLKAYSELDATQRGALDDIVAKYGPNVTLKNPSLSTLVADSMVGEGDTKYGKGGMATDPYTAKELLAELKRFVRADIPGRKLIVVDSVVDLLQSSDPALQRLGAALSIDRAYGVAAGGRAVLVANRIQKGQGRAKFMHEVGTHLGLENLLPKPVYDRLVKQIKDWAESDADTDEVTLAARAVLRVERAGTPDADRDAELLAYFVEEAVKAGIDPTADAKASGPLRDWFRTLWAAFKVAIRKLGMKPEMLTAQDVVDLAFGAARLEIAGTWYGTAADRQRMRFGKDLDAFAKPATRAQVEQTLAKLPAPLRNNIRTVWSTLREYGSRALDRVVFTADLLDRATKAGIKSAKTYQALMVERGVKAREHELRVEAIADLYQAIPSMEEGARANDLARESTRMNRWAYQPEWLDSTVKVDPDLAAQWDKLHPASRKWIDAMFRFEHEMLQRKRKMVLDNATSTYDAMIRAAQEAIDSGNLEGDELKAAKQDLAKAKRDKVNELKRFERLFEMRSNSPYLPLKRFGRWAVVAKSEEYRAAEAAGDAATLRKLEQSGDHYYVDFAESLFEANVMRDKLEAEFGAGSTQHFEREEFSNIYGSEGMLATMTKLRNIIDAQPVEDKGDRTALRRMQSMLSEMYLQALAETSARKSEMRRKGIAGDMDMLRSFTTQGKADALFLSAVEYNDRIQDSIQRMRRETRLAGDRLRASGLFNEIVRRYDQSLIYDPSPITQKITRLTSVWFLASSPVYYIQNLTQPYMMSVPMMAGRHGWAEAAKAQFDAYSQLGPVLKSGTATTGFDFSRVPADVRDAVDYLVKRGLVDIGLDTELGEFRTDGKSRAKAVWNKVDKFLRVSTQKLEAINRLSTAIAAYRLELAKGGDKAAAMEYAAKVINDTHGDYTAFNAPRVFNTNFGKIALQFRKFQLIQLTYLAKLLKDAGFSTPEKRAATAALLFALGHTGIAAGLMGLPGYAAIAWAVNGLFGDDDEPFDLTQKIRQVIGDEYVANLIMRGAPTIVGADMSGKIGMGNALSILPFTDVDLLDRRSSAEALGTLVGGASFGLFQRMADGVALISNGDYYKGIEMLMPKGITDVMKAARIASDGVTRRNGDVLLPASEVSAVESIMQGLGVPVVQQTVRSERQQYVYDMTRRMDEASTKIKNDYAKAARERDTKAMREARQRWDRLQKNRKEAGLRVQPLSSLLQAPQKQAERERNTVRGVQFNANNRGLVEAL